MSKYSYEFKKKVVEEYLQGHGGYKYLTKIHCLSDHKLIRQWVASYKAFGDEGLMRSRQNKEYTFEYKLSVVELYLTTEVSYQELALSFGMNNPPLITKWVNDFRIAGPDALKPKRKGRRSKVDKPKEIEPDTIKSSSNDENLKQLQEENLKLRIENAYLKELRRLRLEEEAQNKKQELSATSEDYSN